MINFLSNSIKFSARRKEIIVGLKVVEAAEKAFSSAASNHSLHSLHRKSKAKWRSKSIRKQIKKCRENTRSYIIDFEISIQDFGCGISPEGIAKLFINFSKLGESANPNGVGLGLSICKMLIEHMNGSVRVDSTEGEGTRFTISFKTTCLLEEEAQPLDHRASLKASKVPITFGSLSSHSSVSSAGSSDEAED